MSYKSLIFTKILLIASLNFAMQDPGYKNGIKETIHKDQLSDLPAELRMLIFNFALKKSSVTDRLKLLSAISKLNKQSHMFIKSNFKHLIKATICDLTNHEFVTFWNNAKCCKRFQELDNVIWLECISRLTNKDHNNIGELWEICEYYCPCPSFKNHRESILFYYYR